MFSYPKILFFNPLIFNFLFYTYVKETGSDSSAYSYNNTYIRYNNMVAIDSQTLGVTNTVPDKGHNLISILA